MGLLAGDRYQPTLFVGLGGNGGRIVNLLASRLRRHPAWPKVESMTHFVVLDTNKDDLDRQRAVPAEGRFLISAFDRQAYVARKRGSAELPPDPLVTSWVHPGYQFRATQASGAGQIRVESRLGLYYALENDARTGFRAHVARVLQQATMRENPWRDHEDREIRILVYASLAGGTGSGAFLPLAWLLRDAVRDLGSWRASTVAFLTLPTCFLDKVKPELHPDILANGYAALKELEYLTRELGYDGGSESIEFHYDPGNAARTRVTERPFSLAYLIDRPESVSVARYEHAVADASFLQLYSPLLGAQSGEYDNYEKHQKRLAAGGFSVHYAAFGASLLHLPRRDVVRYASLRYAAKGFRDYLAFGADHADFRVPWGDPAFERLDPAEQDRKADDKFCAYVAWRARLEEDADEKGLFRGVLAQVGTGGRPLRELLREQLAARYARLDELVAISDVERQSINPGNPSLERALTVLRRESAASAAAVRAWLDACTADVRAGRVLGALFRDHGVNPVSQRYFLVRLLAEGALLPAAEDEWLLADVPRPDLEGAAVQAEKARLEAELAAGAAPGWVQRLTDRDNSSFQAAKQRAVRFVDELAQDCREDLRRTFWRGLEGELRRVAAALASSFRKTAEIADDQARQLDAAAERFRQDPAAEADSDVAEYYLDAEALRDDHRGVRQWDLLWRHRLDSGAFIDAKRIFPVVSDAFAPVREADGAIRARDAGEVVRAVRAGLIDQGSAVYASALDDLGLDLASALELEARYSAAGDVADLDAAVRAVPAEQVRRAIADKLARAHADCTVLAQLDRARADDPAVKPADVLYAALAPALDTEEPGSIGAILRTVVPRITVVEGWSDRDALVLYRAVLGIPVYWFRAVQAAMQPAYRRVKVDARRGYPLHIEAAWEDGLPDLDPVELRRADERRAAEATALAERQARADRVRAFALCEWAALVGGEPSWRWTLDGVEGPLGPSRHAAFAAFEASSMRADLVGEATRRHQRAAADRAGREGLGESLTALAGRLRAAFARAEADRDDAELAFLREERAVVEDLVPRA